MSEEDENLRAFPRVLAPDPLKGVTEYAVKARPMSMFDELAREAEKRYEPGVGPWGKTEDLDQVDLVHLERCVEPMGIYSDMRGLMSGMVDRLVEEVRRARGWPTPPRVEPNFCYVESEDER
jgi:hypothetical protein